MGRETEEIKNQEFLLENFTNLMILETGNIKIFKVVKKAAGIYSVYYDR